MTPMLSTVAVIAKEPVAGRVKTRLIGALSAEDAARLALSALRDTLIAVSLTPCRERVLVLDGAVGDWLPPGWTVHTQGTGTLDERLSAAFDGLPAGPSMLVGMDTPQLRPPDLCVDMVHHDAWLGPATDGGYWCIGFADPSVARSVIEGVPMSTAYTGARQLERMERAGLNVQLLTELRDVDTPSDARAVAAEFGGSEFSQLWRQLDTVGELC